MNTVNEIIENTATLLIEKYNLSTRFINTILEEYKLDCCEEVINQKLSNKDKLIILLNHRGSLFFSGSNVHIIDLRIKIIEKWSNTIIDEEFNKDSKTNGKTRTHKIRVLAEKNWHKGKGWASRFIELSGFDHYYAGFHNDNRKEDFEDILPYKKLPVLKDFQMGLKNRLIETLKQQGDKAKCLISLPTGGGKTRVAVEAFIEWLQPRFSESKYLIWIAQSEELCEQAINCISQVWSAREFTDILRINRFFGTHNVCFDDLSEGGVIVCTINKLYQAIKERTEEATYIIDNCGAIIIDEAHRAITMMYDTLYSYAQERRGKDLFPICGLTATPGRTSDTERLTDFFKYKLFTPDLGTQFETNPLKYFRDKGYLAQPVFSTRTTGYSIDIPDNYSSPEEIEIYFQKVQNKKLSESKDRNRKIINELLNIRKGTSTLVYACTIDHANFLSAIMNYYGRKSVAITSKTDNALRYRFIEKFRNKEIDFIFNHSVLTTGFDAPKTENIVICRPIFSDVLYEQIVGRGLRGVEFGGTPSCEIIDFCDNISRMGDQQSYIRYKDFWSQS